MASLDSQKRKTLWLVGALLLGLLLVVIGFGTPLELGGCGGGSVGDPWSGEAFDGTTTADRKTDVDNAHWAPGVESPEVDDGQDPPNKIPIVGTIYVADMGHPGAGVGATGSGKPLEPGRVHAINSDGTKKWEVELPNPNTTPGQSGGNYAEIRGVAIGPDGTVYAGNAGNGDKIGMLYALDGETGAKKWAFDPGALHNLNNNIASIPVVGNDGTIYFGNQNGYFYAVNNDGTLKWESGFRAGDNARNCAIGVDGTIYCGAGDHKLHAMDGATGVKKWEYRVGWWVVHVPTIGADGTIYVTSWAPPPHVSDGSTYPLRPGTRLYAINPDGTLKWDFQVPKVIPFGLMNASRPAIGPDGTIYFGFEYDEVYAVNPNGTMKWNFNAEDHRVSGSPVVDANGTVYIGTGGDLLQGGGTAKVYALNGQTGAKIWEYDSPHIIDNDRPVVVNNVLYISGSGPMHYNTTDKGKVFALNTLTGAKIWEYEVNALLYCPPVFSKL